VSTKPDQCQLGFLLFAAVVKYAAGRLFGKLLLMPFRAKGAVLKGATAQVHTVSQTTDSGPRRHYLVDVTITPNQTGIWLPGLTCTESRLLA
jgi:hypothetical protein